MTEHLHRRAARGGAIAIGSQAVRLLIQLVTLALMSRLLSPADFGVFAMATSVIALTMIFGDLGLTTATLQKTTINDDDVTTSFFLGLGFSFCVTAVTIALSPFAAAALNNPLVDDLVRALAVTAPLGALATQHYALMQRDMRWVTLQWTGIASTSLGNIVGIIAAFAHAGPYSLVLASLTTAATASFLAWRSCKWRPSFQFSWQNAKSTLGFAGFLSLNSVVSYLTKQFDSLLVGAVFGSELLGFHSRTMSLYSLPQTALITPVYSAVNPVLYRMQSNSQALARTYSMFTSTLTFVCGILGVLLYSYSELIVEIVLGTQWVSTVPTLLKILAFSAPALPLSATAQVFFVAKKQSGKLLQRSLVLALIGCAALLVGQHAGLMGVAVAVSLNVAFASIGWIYAVCVSILPASQDRYDAFLLPASVSVAAISGICVALTFAAMHTTPFLTALAGLSTYFCLSLLLTLTVARVQLLHTLSAVRLAFQRLPSK